MKLSDLSPEIIESLKSLRFDYMLEKHEGPWDWKSWLESAQFVEINGRTVLLPIEDESLPNLTILRCIVSQDEQTLTIFLKDTTHVSDPSQEFFGAGRLAVCDKVVGTALYITVFYHAWYMVENSALRE